MSELTPKVGDTVYHEDWSRSHHKQKSAVVLAVFDTPEGPYCWVVPPGSNRPLSFRASSLRDYDPFSVGP